MANQPPNPANTNLNINLPPPPSVSSHSSAPFTPRSSSFADDSDAEFDPTPLHSPRGGPEYDDLPPSYDEAQHQAVSDALNGIAPLDPNELEAYRLTLNEGPNEPEVWEYRVRGEQLDNAAEHEQAPEYGNITNELGTTVPVQHVQNSDDIQVGRVGPRSIAPTILDSNTQLLDRALNFTRHGPDADVQYAPRLTRCIALPQHIPEYDHGGLQRTPVQFSRAYAKVLHAHCIWPAEFLEFLDGLNALCVAANMKVKDLITGTPMTDATSTIVRDYIRGANEAFFAPRGLRVSLESLSSLIEALAIPNERGQRAGAVASVLDPGSTAIRRAQALHPWIEALEFVVPAPSAQTSLLTGLVARLKAQRDKSEISRKAEVDDPPHSIPEAAPQCENPGHAGPHLQVHHGPGRAGHRGGPWTPFGAPDHEPFDLHSNEPLVRPGQSPFGHPGRGPFGGRRGRFGHPGFGPRKSHCGRNRAMQREGESGPSQSANEWAAWGENLGRWGEGFGKKMGDWGQQFGKQAEVWGQDVGKRAETWGEHMSARASGSGNRSGPPVVLAHADDAFPPGYEAGPHGQETGVLQGVSKTGGEPPKYENKAHEKGLAKLKKEDDASSISSDSSDSDSDSDSDSGSDDEDLPDTQGIFLKRIHSINKQAEAAAQKGKKTPEEIAQERALAIEKVQKEKTAMDLKGEEKISKRGLRKEIRQKRRDLKREHRHKKRELRASYVGKGKATAKRTPDWKQAKKEYSDKKKELKKEKMRLRKEWKEARIERMKARRGGSVRADRLEEGNEMVWVVIENLSA